MAVKDVRLILLYAADLSLILDDSYEGKVILNIYIIEYVGGAVLRSLDWPITSAKSLL